MWHNGWRYCAVRGPRTPPSLSFFTMPFETWNLASAASVSGPKNPVAFPENTPLSARKDCRVFTSSPDAPRARFCHIIPQMGGIGIGFGFGTGHGSLCINADEFPDKSAD